MKLQLFDRPNVHVIFCSPLLNYFYVLGSRTNFFNKSLLQWSLSKHGKVKMLSYLGINTTVGSWVHTAAIWTLTFHKISDFVRVILKVNFKQLYRSKVSIFWPEMSNMFTHFPSIFFRSCQIQCILHTVDAIPKTLNHLSHILASNCNSSISTLYLLTFQKNQETYFEKKNMPKMQNWPH